MKSSYTKKIFFLVGFLTIFLLSLNLISATSDTCCVASAYPLNLNYDIVRNADSTLTLTAHLYYNRFVGTHDLISRISSNFCLGDASKCCNAGYNATTGHCLNKIIGDMPGSGCGAISQLKLFENGWTCDNPNIASVNSDHFSARWCHFDNPNITVHTEGNMLRFDIVYANLTNLNNTGIAGKFEIGNRIGPTGIGSSCSDEGYATRATFVPITASSIPPVIPPVQNKTCYKDSDNDKYSPGNITLAPQCPTGYYETPHFILLTGDCNDNNPAVHPNAIETLNKIDDNCDGSIDEGFPPTPTQTCVGQTTLDFFHKSTINFTKNGISTLISDSCNSNNSLTEYFCSGNLIFNTTMSCNCSLGACATQSNPTNDTTAPVITLVSPKNNSVYNGTSATVNFIFNITDNSNISTCSANVSGNLWTITNAIVKNVNNTISVNLNAGNYSAYIFCYDIYGNMGKTSQINIKVTPTNTTTPADDTDTTTRGTTKPCTTTPINLNEETVRYINPSNQTIMLGSPSPAKEKTFWTSFWIFPLILFVLILVLVLLIIVFRY